MKTEKKPMHGPRTIEHNGRKLNQNVYDCGCIASVCLCGCDNAPYIIECPTHGAALAMLMALREAFEIMQENNVDDVCPGTISRITAAIARAEGRETK